jgi:glycosyltransferase involved in cell wall biosynthesis
MTNSMLNDAPLFVPVPTLPPPTEPLQERDVIERVEAVFAEVDSLWDLLDVPEPPAAPVPVNELSADLRVSVIIPVYNDRNTVMDVIAGVKALPFETEIIVVDDASTDGTAGWLETIRGASGLEVILKRFNEGKGAALRDGFDVATGNIIVVQDAGLEYAPCNIEKMIRPIVTGDADVVYGSRFLYLGDRKQSGLRRFANWSLTKASNFLTGLRLTDMETSQKAFRANVLRGLTLRENRFGFEPEVTAKLARRRYRVVERSIRYHPTPSLERKTRGLLDAVNAMYCIARYGLRD